MTSLAPSKESEKRKLFTPVLLGFYGRVKREKDAELKYNKCSICNCIVFIYIIFRNDRQH